MADVLRRLIRLSVSTAPSAGETQRLTAQLAAVADELETHTPEMPDPALHGARSRRPAQGGAARWRHAL